MKKVRSFRLEEETIKLIEDIAYKEKKGFSDVIETLANFYITMTNQCVEENEILMKENRMLLKQIELLESERKAIEKVEQLYNEIIAQKDYEIKKLKDEIEELKLKNKKRGWFRW